MIVPTYEDIRTNRRDFPNHKTFLNKLDQVMDRYAV